MRAARGFALALFASALVGCAAPFLARDGTLVFPEEGARGAAVLTANGVEFHDRAFVPPRIVRRDPHEPWRAPIGFILPKDGRFTQTSRATVIATPGLAVVLRPSDTRVPSWGGEILIRLEVFAPAAADEARAPERVVLVVDPSDEVMPLVDAALDGLGAQDRVSLVDTSGAVLLQPVPGRYRTLVAAAAQKRVTEAARRVVAPAAAFKAARKLAASAGSGITRVVVLSDAAEEGWASPAVAKEVEALAGDGVRVSFIGVSPAMESGRLGELSMTGAGIAGTGQSIEARRESVALAVPPSGRVRFRNVVVSFHGAPAPSQVLEASSGEVRWRLDAGEVDLGDVSAGEGRAEVLRVSVPAWVPGEPFVLYAETRFLDVEREMERTVSAEVVATYDDDIERIAQTRHGDVIAFASALATLKRLDRAFVGEGVDRFGGLRSLATMHARSMTLLARDTKDPAIREQAEVINALLAR